MASSRGARRNADATDSEVVVGVVVVVAVAVGVAVVVAVVVAVAVGVGVGMKPPTPDADAAFINIVCRLRMLSRNCANLGTDGIYTYDSTGLAILEIANQLETGAAGRTSGAGPVNPPAAADEAVRITRETYQRHHDKHGTNLLVDQFDLCVDAAREALRVGKEPICPYCHEPITDSNEDLAMFWSQPLGAETECDECGKTVNVEVFGRFKVSRAEGGDDG